MFEVLGFYKFIKIKSLKKNKVLLQDFLIRKKIRGTIIIAKEGLNGTISGEIQNIKSTIYKLHNSIQYVLNKAIKHNGTTIIDFSYVNGQSGNYANELNIYGKKSLICSKCKTEVVKIKVASRGTYFCRCQKVY